MDIKALCDGIYAEFVADSDLKTALGGDSARRMYDTQAPQNPSYPYCVYQYITGNADGTFTSVDEFVQFQFSIFHKSDDPLDKTTINDVFKKLCACYDDSELTVSGYSSIYVTRTVSNFVATEDDTQQYVVNYEIFIQNPD
jgi:hypothetical protein